ncbi:unnamed protein product [Arabis nemorensis]|uniref:GPI inositol-deacylase PGAP1-like alpha/beta domain-containing protein n=1 Tax=Arabis nemorensis TaxID=586526 RepID=A0A565BS71_9BRAS|nr:unnamed protein product [Arabis nemorensis]
MHLYHEGWRKIDFKEHLQKLSGVPVLFIPGNASSYKQVRSVAAESDRAYQGGPFERTFYQEASVFPGGAADTETDYDFPSRYSNRLDWFAVDLEGEHSAMDGCILEEHTEYVVYAIHRYKESHDTREREGAARLHCCSPSSFAEVSCANYSNTLKSTPITSSGIAAILGALICSCEPRMEKRVRSKLESLDGIVPSSHGFIISSTSMKNVWLSMEHQAILWCNQLVVQVSHTLLSLVDSKTAQPFSDTQKRLQILTRMLQSALAQSFNGMTPMKVSHEVPMLVSKVHVILLHARNTVLSIFTGSEYKFLPVPRIGGMMLSIGICTYRPGSNGKKHFIFVTNLAPCSGVRLHLWPEKEKSNSDLPVCERVLEVTSKMVLIPADPAPKQILDYLSGPSRSTLSPRYLCVLSHFSSFQMTKSVTEMRPSLAQAVSGKPPVAVSMAVGQFFNPEEGTMEVSSQSILLSTYSAKEIFLKEDHPLAYNLSFAVSLGLVPITLSLKTAGCGIKTFGLPDGETGDLDKDKLCKLRCFPPVALAWDSSSGLHIVGFSFAVILFALMRQAYQWDQKLSVPPLLSAMEYNLEMPSPFLLLAAIPLLCSLFFSFLMAQPIPPLASFTVVSLIWYLLANAFITVLIIVSKLAFQLSALVHTTVRSRCQALERNYSHAFLHWFSMLASSFVCLKAIRILKLNTTSVMTLAAVTLVSFVHPALGLFVLLASHALCCHNSMCWNQSIRKKQVERKTRHPLSKQEPLSGDLSEKSFVETQADIFNHRHGLLILHLLASLMFVPSLAAWFQRIGTGQIFPWFADSALYVGVIFHGILNSRPESSILRSFPSLSGHQLRPHHIYLLAGYYCFFLGLDLAPYKVFYAIAALGYISLTLKISQLNNNDLRFRTKSRIHRN